MQFTKPIIRNLAFTLAASVSCSAFSQDYLIHNVNGYTINQGKLTQFNAIAFNQDNITAVHHRQLSKADITKSQQANVSIIDAQGKVMLPGLIDAHGHVLSYGKSLLRVRLNGSKSEQEAVTKVIKYAKENPNQTWITGRGWNQVLWQSKQFPTVELLDKAFPNTPVALGRVDGHALWVNSKALELVGISANTQSPEGGEIIKDKKGNPTGVLIDNAMDIIYQSIPAFTEKETKAALIRAMNSLASVGLTSVHDAGISVDNVNAYKALAKADKMPIRVNAMLSVLDKDWLSVIEQGHYVSQHDMFKLDSVKISSDGALGSRGAALFEDYADLHGHKGLLLFTNEQLGELINTAMAANFQVNTHAIGDKANHLVLNHYQNAIKKHNAGDRRHRIEHAQILTLPDIPRFSALDIIPSMQATHATSDKNMAQDRLGKERLKGAYAWQTLLEGGNIIANGSDFPVESANPFFGLHAAITRQDHQNLPAGGWLGHEKMTKAQALKSFTIDAAYAGHQEHIIGSLEVGKKADFILLENDIFTQPEQTIWQNKVSETWVNGRQVYPKL